MTVSLRLTLCLLLGWLSISPLRAEQVLLQEPPPGEHAEQAIEAEFDYQLDALFEQLDHAEIVYPDLHLVLQDGRRLVLRDWYDDAGNERARLVVAGEALSSADVLAIPGEAPVDLIEELPATAAGPGSSSGGSGPRQAGEGFQTARRLLFPEERADAAFGFHSYLLFDKADDSGIAFERRKAAIEAYFAEVSSLTSMLDLDIPESEINVFWLPMSTPDDGRSPADLHELSDSNQAAKMVSLALSHYDFARARALLRRLDLSGGGPWIVSYPDPLSSTAAVTDPDRLLVQDLSRAPPRLVRSWVQHFKRRLEDEPAGVSARLRGFFLALRSEIANLAEGLAITRDAVAMTLGEAALPTAAAAESEEAGVVEPTPESAPTSSDAPPRSLPVAADADSPMVTEHALQPSAGLPSPLALPQDDAAGQRWLQARHSLALAQGHAAENDALLRSRLAWLELQLQRERLALQGQLDRDLQAMQRMVQRMLESGVFGVVVEARVSLAAAESKAQLAKMRRQQQRASQAWQPWAAQAERAGEMPEIRPALLPESVSTAVEMARQWHPGLQLRRAELVLLQAESGLSTTGSRDCSPHSDGAESLSLRPRCNATVEQRKASLRQAQRSMQQAEAEAARISGERWRDYRQLDDEVAALTEASATADKFFELITRQFDVGQRSPAELLNALRQRFELGDRLLQRQQARDAAALQLLLATGQLPQLASPANSN